MTTVEQALLIILSTCLAIVLVLTIIIAVKIIQILKHIRIIVAKAENIADKAEAVSDFFQQTAGPTAIVKLISNIFNATTKNKSSK